MVNFLNDVFTVPANLAGLPGISVPAGVNADGLPLGLQVLGKPYDEASLYRVAGVLEQAAAFTQRRPAGQEVQHEPACNRAHRRLGSCDWS